MRTSGTGIAGIYRIASILALACSASAHSWIEYAFRIAPNGTMVGDRGYARGYMPRNETGWKDSIPQLLLPVQGQSAYSGREVINKYPFTAKPEFPMLEAAAGDHIAIIHFENGHVTLPQNQPNKPLNRGTIFFYGTSEPKEQEKLFDVHLLWNNDGTGGDKRGTLLATRNYDDGQCFQPNTAEITDQRVSKLGVEGAKSTEELPCQSDIKLPADLKPGSIYTIYWYWDWPSLNPSNIDMSKTINGDYPWAGSFMRGDKVPNGWTMGAIAHNESYASVIDIKIVENQSIQGFAAKDAGVQEWVSEQNIYSKAIKGQMNNNFQVNPAILHEMKPSGSDATLPTATSGAAGAPTTGVGRGGDGVTTVTVTVPATTLMTTIYKTVKPSSGNSLAAPSSTDDAVTVVVTVTTHVPPGPAATTAAKATASVSDDYDFESSSIKPLTTITPSGVPAVTPFMPRRRGRRWPFGS